MKTTTKTALANLELSKGKNILSGVAIALTTLLIFLIITLGSGIIRLQIETVNQFYPSWEVMFRDVNEANADKLAHHAEISEIGRRLDVASTSVDETSLLLMYNNEASFQLNKVKLAEGKLPQEMNEIALTREGIEAFGGTVAIGETLELPYQLIEKGELGLEQRGTFTISGIVASTESQDSQNYSAFVSETFAKSAIAKEDRRYRLMLKLADVEELTVPAINALGQEIGKAFDVGGDDVVENGPYLTANYIDPGLYGGIGMLILIVVLAGTLTTYSIYYVSMIDKVQVFGKLKALGATKGQIRSIVFQEGFIVGVLAIPLGLVLGALSSLLLFNGFVKYSDAENSLTKQMVTVVQTTGFSVLQPWIFGAVALISLLTIWISLLKPMRIASKISPVEAMRFMGETNTKKKARKGYREMTLSKLTLANLSHNRKKTLLTIFTLGLTGIMFMTMAAILSCIQPENIARYEVASDYRIETQSWTGDKMNPDREWTALIQNNPLTPELEAAVLGVDGVTSLVKRDDLDVELVEFEEDNKPQAGTIRSLSAEDAEANQAFVVDGAVNYDELVSKQGVLISEVLYKQLPEIAVGSTLTLDVLNGKEKVRTDFEVLGWIDGSQGLMGSYADIYVADTLFKTFSEFNTTRSFDIEIEPSKLASATTALNLITNSNEYLNAEKYQDQLKKWESTLNTISLIGYSFMAIIGGVGVMSLINTVVNSIYSRKRELGIIQALGMTEKQLIKMLQFEGLVYTLGTVLLSLTLGNLLGFLAYRYAVVNSLFNIKTYIYPWQQTLLLIIVVIGVQLILTVLVSRSFRKESLVERMRFAE